MLVARCCAVARRRRRAALILGAASIARLPPTNHRRRPPRGDRPLPHPAPHRRLAQVAHPAGRSRMLIAVHGAARPPAAAATSASSFHEKNSAKKNRRRRPAGGTSGSVGSRVAPLTDGAGSARPSCAREFGASLVNMLNQDRGALDRRKRLTPPQRRRPDQRLQEFVPILEQIDALRDALYDCTERLFDTVNKSPADLRSGYHRFLQLGGSTATDFRRYLRGQPLPRYGNGASRGYGRLRLIVKTSSGQSKC